MRKMVLVERQQNTKDALGLNLYHHSGGRQRSLDHTQGKIKLVVEAFETMMPRHDYVKTKLLLMASKGLIECRKICNFLVGDLLMGCYKNRRIRNHTSDNEQKTHLGIKT